MQALDAETHNNELAECYIPFGVQPELQTLHGMSLSCNCSEQLQLKLILYVSMNTKSA
jgi:hypothetical protein